MAEVIRATPSSHRIDVGATPVGWEPRASRILIRSDGHPLNQPIGDTFAGLDPGLVSWLADRGVELIGVDSPSVDPISSTGLEAHRALIERGISWIEGLWLENVECGLYLMVALPLRLVGTEAAPVRALVRPLRHEGGAA